MIFHLSLVHTSVHYAVTSLAFSRPPFSPSVVIALLIQCSFQRLRLFPSGFILLLLSLLSITWVFMLHDKPGSQLGGSSPASASAEADKTGGDVSTMNAVVADNNYSSTLRTNVQMESCGSNSSTHTIEHESLASRKRRVRFTSHLDIVHLKVENMVDAHTAPHESQSQGIPRLWSCLWLVSLVKLSRMCKPHRWKSVTTDFKKTARPPRCWSKKPERFGLYWGERQARATLRWQDVCHQKNWGEKASRVGWYDRSWSTSIDCWQKYTKHSSVLDQLRWYTKRI